MNLLFRILLFWSAAVIAASVTSCSGVHYDEPGQETVMLTIRVKLSDNGSFSRAVGDEYETDKEAKSGENMQSLRVIILDRNNVVEHNSLWDAWSEPVTESGVKRFKVKGNEDKTIIFVANENGSVITDRGGVTHDAGNYFRQFNPSVGTVVNVDDMHALTMALADNKTNGTDLAGNLYDDSFSSDLRRPLAINGIYTGVHIGSEAEQSKTFWIGRAAVKYTFRITNSSSVNHTLSSLTIGRVASQQYYFQNAVYTDDDHFFWSSYSTPAATTEDLVINLDKLIPNDGKIYEFGPYYVPEGAVFTTPYQVGLVLDGDLDTGLHDISWSMPQTPDDKTLMLDLPRNTHVITEIKLNNTKPTFNYTICLWDKHEIEIPDFN